MGLTSSDYILAFWLSSNNFGDNLNHFLIKQLSGKTPVLATDRNKPHYICCGSILGEFTESSSIWGAGFFYDHQLLHFDIPIHAVRGELTRALVRKDTVVGDPALLLPLLYYPGVKKERKVGIIPHWSNVQKIVELYPDAHIIDPMQSTKDFIDDVLSCDNVFSESLHGLIVADTYGVNNKWVDFGFDSGGAFKYNDYYSTTETQNETPLVNKINVIETSVHKYKYNLQTLLNSCPFYNGKYQ